MRRAKSCLMASLAIIMAINKLLSLIEKHGLDGFLVPSNDEFQSEYTPEYNNRLKFLTSFTGSNGIALITKKKLVFFTDGRYLLQAKRELSEDFIIENITHLYDNKYLFGKIGFDPKLHLANAIERFKNCELIACENLVDLIWENRPKYIQSKIFDYPAKYAGESKESKLQKISQYLKINNFDAIIITDPYNICWLLNIRGDDVPYNPVILSYAVCYQDRKIELVAIEEFTEKVKPLKNKQIEIDPSSASIWVMNHFVNPILKQDPCVLLKACKNKKEIKQAKEIHIIDGVALTKLLFWLESSYKNITEIDIGNKLLEYRSLSPRFITPSFATIAGFAENGAVIHYHANQDTNKKLDKDGLLLIDSGGHYYGGTTDITRVIPIGRPTHEQKLNFTLVLKGHIALAQAKFPKGTSGADLDILARQFLWKEQKDYPHGTGHGVGNCLNVHEGPQRISKFSRQELIEGMILSNEPGYYKNGEYGIRLENLMVVKKTKDSFLEFETISLAPISKKLILKKLLSIDEMKWLNNYHKKIYKELSPFLSSKEKIWLKSTLI